MNMVCNIPATNFHPMNVLDKHGLDGLCIVAYKSFTDGDAVFCIDDTSHVCKRVGAAMKNKALQWDWDKNAHPMCIKTLRAVFVGI
jgi:hypothetical protein